MLNKETNTYKQLKDAQMKKYDDFFTTSNGIFYAFGNEQFKKGMESIGLKEDETDKIYSFGSGMYYKKEITKNLADFFRKQDQELEEAKKDDQFLYDMFICEMGNHEFGYTRDLTDTIAACGYTIKEIEKDARVENILLKAKKDYIKWDNENN